VPFRIALCVRRPNLFDGFTSSVSDPPADTPAASHAERPAGLATGEVVSSDVLKDRLSGVFLRSRPASEVSADVLDGRFHRWHGCLSPVGWCSS